MEEWLTVVLLSLAMLTGCYIAGLIPMAFSFSEDKLKLVTVLGAGLLVGTSLAVIIPEAVHNMYSTQSKHAEAGHESHVHEKTVEGQGHVEAAEGEGHEHHHDHPMIATHTAIGLSLVVGFIFMLLVDQIGGGGHSHAPVAADAEGTAPPAVQNRYKITATLGLVVHAAADGIALGAAISTAEAHVTYIVFIAIMLHKAPAAFGLTSFLLHGGFDKPRIKKHLAAFACSAPVLAILTYVTLSTQNKQALSQINATGIAMLFSAGTFLYVATVHVLPEIKNMGPSKAGEDPPGFTKKELLAMVVGSIIPAVLSLGHSH